ncbi:MAG: DUF192 domain-containing protein [Parcubacteria group bacterium]|nr:DUF192 domain-containing protein [Parcubacteria group bacterium]
MKTYSLMLGIVTLIVLVFLGISRAIPQKMITKEAPTPTATPSIQIGDTTIPVELAKTPAELERGLSYRTSLDRDKGMLFIFEKSGFYKFWMPHMNFPLDVLWIDENKRIVSINEHVPPLEDISKPIYYEPTQPALYVLEVNANFSKKYNIKIGDQLIFQNIDN